MSEDRKEDILSREIIVAAIEGHRELGAGLLESSYEECFCHELQSRKITYARQKSLPVTYKDIRLDCGYRLDVIVDNLVIVEIKAVECMLPIHTAQLLTYLKLANLKLGLLINFNTQQLRQGIKRVVNNL